MTNTTHDDIIARLERSVVTATNDDLSEPMTNKRARHIDRLDAMRDAIDALRSMRAEIHAHIRGHL